MDFLHSKPINDLQFEHGIIPCFEDGQPRKCFRGQCNGSIKPPKCRHCGDCNVDREDFDHHCPWLDSCISRDTLPWYLLILLLMPLTTMIGCLPIISNLISNFKLVQKKSLHDHWVNDIFWSQWYSFLPGPIGNRFIRYTLGFWILGKSDSDRSVIDVRFDIALLAFSSFVISIVAIALAKTTIRGISNGTTSVDIGRKLSYDRILTELKSRPNDPRLLNDLKTLKPIEYFFIPSINKVINVSTDVHDLGYKRNWKRALCEFISYQVLSFLKLVIVGQYTNNLNMEFIEDAINKQQ